MESLDVVLERDFSLVDSPDVVVERDLSWANACCFFSLWCAKASVVSPMRAPTGLSKTIPAMKGQISWEVLYLLGRVDQAGNEQAYDGLNNGVLLMSRVMSIEIVEENTLKRI